MLLCASPFRAPRLLVAAPASQRSARQPPVPARPARASPIPSPTARPAGPIPLPVAPAAAAGAGRAAAARAPAADAAAAGSPRWCRPGQVALYLTARFGRDQPPITGGLIWRVYPDKPDNTGAFRPVARGAHRRADVRAAGRQLHRACRVRTCPGGETGAAARRDRARDVRNSGRRHPHRRPRRRRQNPARPDPFRHLQGQPVRARRQAADGVQHHDRRHHAGAGRHLSHRVAITATATRWCAPTSACRSAR